MTPCGDEPSDVCQGIEKPLPLAVSDSVFSARRVVESPNAMLSLLFCLAKPVMSRVRRMWMMSEREVAEGREWSMLFSRSVLDVLFGKEESLESGDVLSSSSSR